MKVALCFSGFERDVLENYSFWDAVIKKYDADVYGSFWEVPNHEKVFGVYNPVRFEYESYDVFKDTTHNIAKIHVNSPNAIDPFFQGTTNEFGQFSMYYRVWKCNMLCASSGINYDVVVRCRTDTVFDSIDFIEVNDCLNVPIGINYCSALVNSAGVNDCFAFGKPIVMNYYAFVVFKMMEYIDSGHYAFPPEHFLAVHFSKIDINIHFVPVLITITRKWKGVADEVYNKFVNNMVGYDVHSSELVGDIDRSMTFKNDNFISDFKTKLL